MRREPHPISGAVYQEVGEGLVRVEDKERGKYGVFRWDGVWIEGELTYADPHMLNYIGGPDLPPGRDIFWGLLPPVVDLSQPAPVPTPEEERAAAQMPRIIGKYARDPGQETPEGMRSAAHIDQDFFLENDRKAELIPEAYRKQSPMPGGPKRINVERYFKKEYHDLEVERLWKRTWQMVCREDDIPEVGDYHIYQVASLSFLIVRTGEQEFKAHYNACLHRGRQLRDCDGKKAHEFRCPFHGWCWGIDGSLKDITTEWDFPGVREDVARLPGAKVATWGGFVFINPDHDAVSLEEFMGPVMIGHYAKFKMESRYKQAHVARIIRANWKVAMEAFMEAYHVIATHPQQMLVSSDLAQCHYDVFGNWGRAGHAQGGAASPQRAMFVTPEQALESHRRSADYNREFLRNIIGDEVEQFSDVELTDSTFNNLFPNFQPWAGWGRIVFRWRPVGDNPDECVMDVMLLAPWPQGKPKPPTVKQHSLGADEPWTDAPEIASLARILEQDVGNMPKVQLGLKTKQPPYVWHSAYQEGIIRNFHENYERALGLKDGVIEG